MDTWTSSSSSSETAESLTSVYGHWLDADWTRQSALLYTSHLPARQPDHTRLPQDHTQLLHDALDCWALTADMVCTVTAITEVLQ